MPIIHNMAELIGHTPLLRLKCFGNVFGKLEYFNPLSSAKDRAAFYMIREAEKAGQLRQGGVIVEPTSGNTGIALAGIAASKGYRVLLTMPETMSVERRRLLQLLGAEVILTSAEQGMQGAADKAKELAESLAGAWMPNQFANPANAAAHYEMTGPEIWADTEGQVELFVACVGTGGTLTGIGRYLKEKNPGVKVIAVEPAESPLLSGGKPGSHGIQGIGANFIPELLDRSLIDEIITVSTNCAIQTARKAAQKEGIGVGISSGAALWAAAQLAKRRVCVSKSVVVLLPDGAQRYLSGGLCES